MNQCPKKSFTMKPNLNQIETIFFFIVFYIVFYETSLKPFGFTFNKNGFKIYFIFLHFIFFSFYSMVFNENNTKYK